jgi:hypothetical protein
MFSSHLLVGSLVTEDGCNEHKEPMDKRDEVTQNTRIETIATQVHRGLEQSTDDCSTDHIVNISKRGGVVIMLKWSLPPSEIYDGRLFKKVG